MSNFFVLVRSYIKRQINSKLVLVFQIIRRLTIKNITFKRISILIFNRKFTLHH